MVVYIAQYELRLTEQPGSLKAKRHVVKSLIERLRSRLGVAVAEVGHNDLWQRARIGITSVSSSRHVLEQVRGSVEHLIEGDGRVEILDAWVELQSVGTEPSPRPWRPTEHDTPSSEPEGDQP